MPRTHFVWMSLFLFCGCSSWESADADARRTAHETYRQLLVLKREVQKKIDAERSYYRDTVDTLTESSARAAYLAGQAARVSKAQALAERLAKEPEKAAAESILESVLAGAAESASQRKALEAERRTARATMERSIQKLSELKEEYAALESVLVELSSPASKGSLVEVTGFIVRAAEHYRELEKNTNGDK